VCLTDQSVRAENSSTIVICASHSTLCLRLRVVANNTQLNNAITLIALNIHNLVSDTQNRIHVNK
jgi:hypothetical protein